MLAAVSLTHKTAPLPVRERLAFAEADLPAALPSFTALAGVTEAYLLSTCNRTEVYLVGRPRPDAGAAAAVLSRLRGTPTTAFWPYLETLEGDAAARHILRVAAGLESLVVGEAQVLGQVRRAFVAARSAGTTGPVLNRLLQVAIACGRRVRAETGLGRHALSVPHAAAAVARRTVGTAGRRMVLVGAGEIAALAAKIFAQSGAQISAVANRTVANAALLAARYGAEAVDLTALPRVLADADLVVVSVTAPAPVLTAAALSAARRPAAAPLLVLDISVPRGVEPAAAHVAGVMLYDLDALGDGSVAVDAAPERMPEVQQAEDIVEGALESFLRWQAARAAVPVIAALHRRAERIVEAELARAGSRLSRLNERERRAVRGVVEGAVHKLLHASFVRLRARAGDERMMQLARELFDLDGEGARRGV
jgi:glutamyl-tRNA reductase